MKRINPNGIGNCHLRKHSLQLHKTSGGCTAPIQESVVPKWYQNGWPVAVSYEGFFQAKSRGIGCINEGAQDVRKTWIRRTFQFVLSRNGAEYVSVLASACLEKPTLTASK